MASLVCVSWPFSVDSGSDSSPSDSNSAASNSAASSILCSTQESSQSTNCLVLYKAQPGGKLQHAPF